jgi:hypothetical protein
MGWASGVDICVEIWSAIRNDVDYHNRSEVLSKIIRVVENHDCDNMDEILSEKWPEVKEALELARSDDSDEDGKYNDEWE